MTSNDMCREVLYALRKNELLQPSGLLPGDRVDGVPSSPPPESLSSSRACASNALNTSRTSLGDAVSPVITVSVVLFASAAFAFAFADADADDFFFDFFFDVGIAVRGPPNTRFKNPPQLVKRARFNLAFAFDQSTLSTSTRRRRFAKRNR